MASANHSGTPEEAEPAPPDGEEEEQKKSVMEVQSHYLRCASPSSSMMSQSTWCSDADSIFMEPIHLSSAIAAKKIINEVELGGGRSASSWAEPAESMLESANQLMVEDLYNRVRELMDERSPYNTPCVLDLQRALARERPVAPGNAVDEVWPNVFIADKSLAVNKARLKRMGVTHIVNAAHGTGVYTSPAFYAAVGIQYRGVELDDFPDANIAPHFRPTAEFVDEALLTHKGKVLVVSMMGVSRAAVLVASYLMIFQHLSIMEALTSIRNKRPINPNEGFLKQLRQLNETLMEERDDDDDTLSQCSVIDARTRARIFNEGGDVDDNDDTDKEEEPSLVEVKARSIIMEEEEDQQSVISSSVASSASAAVALKSPHNGMHNQEEFGDQDKFLLPEEEVEDEANEDLDGMIREWQRRNQKYQDDGWWEEQLNSDEEDEDGEKKSNVGRDDESVTSEEVHAVKEQVKRRLRHPASDTASTASYSSYADLWRQRLREIEEQAAARYRKKDKNSLQNLETEWDGEKKIEEEVQSIMSDSSSMFNFCHKNKETLTPLERWRVKRITFGWNKKDREDSDGSSLGDGEKGDAGGDAKTPSLQDVNLTAYQAWKLRQQKRFGEENQEEILEMSRGDDSASVKRRQKREEILERSKKTLEESQSMCGWESESCVSGGTVPLSAFWAGVTGPPTSANDDNMSTLSGRSTVISSVSQPRSLRSSQPGPPVLPVPTVQGPGGEPVVNLASIQNWIANVVTETIKQKQSEMSRPSSELANSVFFGRPAEDEGASLLSTPSFSGSQRPRPASSVLSEGSSRFTAGMSSLGTPKKSKITTTSVPLFSLFQDQVDLNKLDALDQEIKSEMKDKMDTYERKKILEDNKRSTLYKKKKPKDQEEEEEEQKRREDKFLDEAKKKEKLKKTYGLSGCLNLNPSLEKDQNTSVDDWLKSVRPPQTNLPNLYDDLEDSASEFDFSNGRTLYSGDDDEQPYGLPSLSTEGCPSGNGFTRSPPFTPRSRYRSQDEQRQTTTEEEEEDDVATFIAQTRKRIRARAADEAGDDEVLAAWRAQQEAKSPRK